MTRKPSWAVSSASSRTSTRAASPESRVLKRAGFLLLESEALDPLHHQRPGAFVREHFEEERFGLLERDHVHPGDTAVQCGFDRGSLRHHAVLEASRSLQAFEAREIGVG